MQTPAGSLIAAEQTLHVLEEQALIHAGRPVSPSPVTVTCWCADPVDVRLLAASLASDPLMILTRPQNGTARRIPLTISGGPSLELTLTFTTDAGKNNAIGHFDALEQLGIDMKNIISTIPDGFVTLGTDHKKPWTLTDTDSALAVLVDACFTSDNDLAAHIGTITLTVPIDRFDGATISMNRGKPVAPPEVIWLVAPPRELTAKETAGIATLAGHPGDAMVLPFLTLPDGTDIRDKAGLTTHLDMLNETVSTLVTNGGYTAIPVAGGIFGRQNRTDGKYLSDLFATMWNLTIDAGLARSQWRTSIEDRRDYLADTLMAPQDSIIRLLTSHAVLKQLLAFEMEPPPTAPRKDSLATLRDTGINIYSEILSGLAPVITEPPAAKDKSMPPVPEPAAEPVAPEEVAAEVSEPEKATEEPAIEEPAPVAEATEPEPEPEPEPDERFLDMAAFFEQVARLPLFSSDGERIADLAAGLVTQALQRPKTIPEEPLVLMDHLVRDAAMAIKEREKSIDADKKKLKKLSTPKKPDINPDQMEKLEQIEMFWQDFVPAALRKISIKKYDDDVRSTIAREKKAFIDYLALTPDIDEGFIECRDKYWPNAAKTTTQKVNELFNDILDLWQLTIGQQLSTLEDFRRERFPEEPTIDCDTTLKTKRRPTMKEKLAVTIPKKPGIITKILTMKAESSVWREQQIATFTKEGNKLFESYRADAIAWLKDAYESVRTLLDNHLKTSQQSAEAVRTRVDTITAPLVPDKDEVDSLTNAIAKDEKALNRDCKALEEVTTDWEELKRNISTTADMTG